MKPGDLLRVRKDFTFTPSLSEAREYLRDDPQLVTEGTIVEVIKLLNWDTSWPGVTVWCPTHNYYFPDCDPELFEPANVHKT